MQLKEEISTKRYQNVEEMHPKRKMSWKAPQNREELRLQRENVLETTPKPGETTAVGRRGSTDATKNAIPIKGRRFLFERQW